MIIDGHSHVTLPVEDHIREMDETGVDITVLFSTSFHPEFARNAEEAKASMVYLKEILSGKWGSVIEIRKKAVDELMNAIKLFPDRYIGFGNVPINVDLETTKQFIEDNIIKNELAGIGEFTFGGGDAHLMENVFKAAADFEKMPVWIHGFFPVTLSDIKSIAGYARQYPQTPVILGHLGGCYWLESMELAQEVPNLYLDTSASYSFYILGIIINALPRKCIFGVDRPFGDIGLSIGALKKAAKSAGIANAVLSENIATILGL